MLGIDIYRYQTVFNWTSVVNAGVRFVYVKASDGGGPAIVRADSQVNGAKSVGLPVGLYHYAQFSPSPEAQADILTGEVRRLGADGLPPALDLEDPFKPDATAKQFARRFLARLRENGFDRFALYANTSMLSGIGAESLRAEFPELVIWGARYGANNGTNLGLGGYTGTVDVHQYTSVGRVAGITGNVDLNEALNAFWEEDMPTAKEIADEVWNQVRPRLDDPNTVFPMWMWLVGANMGAWDAADGDAPPVDPAAVVAGLTAALVPILREEIAKLDPDSDPEVIANAVAAKFAEQLGRKQS